MAFKTVNSSENSTPAFKRYIGVAPARIVAVNPTKDELEKIYGTTLNNEINYVSKTPDGKEQIRIDMILEIPISEKENIYTKDSFFLIRDMRTGSRSGKIQIGDKYGQYAWATKEDISAKRIPEYANGPARIDADYHPAYIGEERLVSMIRALLCIPDTRKYDSSTNSYVDRKGAELEVCEGYLENIKSYFSGNITELKDVVKLGKDNAMYVMLGVRTTADNKMYQSVYPALYVRGSRRFENALNDFEKSLKESKDNGLYSDTEYKVCMLKEYSVEPTDFTVEKNETKEFVDIADDMPEDDFPFGM